MKKLLTILMLLLVFTLLNNCKKDEPKKTTYEIRYTASTSCSYGFQSLQYQTDNGLSYPSLYGTSFSEEIVMSSSGLGEQAYIHAAISSYDCGFDKYVRVRIYKNDSLCGEDQYDTAATATCDLD